MAPFRDNALCVDDNNSAQIDKSLDAAHLSRHVECLRLESRDSNSINKSGNSSASDLPKVTLEDKKNNIDYTKYVGEGDLFSVLGDLFSGKLFEKCLLTAKQKQEVAVQVDEHNKLAFSIVDTDHSGTLSLNEVAAAAKHPDPALTKLDIRQMQKETANRYSSPGAVLITLALTGMKPEALELSQKEYLYENRYS